MHVPPASALTIGAVATGIGAGIFAGTHLEPEQHGDPTGGELAGLLIGVTSAPLAFAGLLQLGGGSRSLGAAMVAPAIGTILGAALSKD